MGFSDQMLRTIKCDNPDCPKTVTFDLKDIKTIQETEWLKGVRMVKTGDGRDFSYCSDVCEVKGVTTGAHNLKEKPAAPQGPAIVPTATDADVKAAAAQAAAQDQLNKDLKSGEAQIIV